jgi:CysZ protein
LNKLFTGFRFAFRGIGFLGGNRDLWGTAILPVLINAVVFVGGLITYIVFFPDILHWLVDYPQAWWQWIVYVLAILLLVAVAALVIVFGFTLIGCVIAAPFLDTLSEKVERKEGWTAEPAGVRQSLRDIFGSMRFALMVLALFAISQGLLLLLLLLPGLGAVAYGVLAPLLGGFFFALEFFNLPLARRRLSAGAQIRYALDNLGYTVGFGVAVFFTTLVPLLNFLLLPAAAVGATLLVRELEKPPSETSSTG